MQASTLSRRAASYMSHDNAEMRGKRVLCRWRCDHSPSVRVSGRRRGPKTIRCCPRTTDCSRADFSARSTAGPTTGRGLARLRCVVDTRQPRPSTAPSGRGGHRRRGVPTACASLPACSALSPRERPWLDRQGHTVPHHVSVTHHAGERVRAGHEKKSRPSARLWHRACCKLGAS